jgi:hypothetical protein
MRLSKALSKADVYSDDMARKEQDIWALEILTGSAQIRKLRTDRKICDFRKSSALVRRAEVTAFLHDSPACPYNQPECLQFFQESHQSPGRLECLGQGVQVTQILSVLLKLAN